MITIIRFSCVAVVLLLALAQTVEAATVEVFLLGGQSNAVARAYSSGLPIDLQQPQTDVDFYFSSPRATHPWENQLIDLQPGSSDGSQTDQFGPEVSFGRDMADYYASDPNTSVAIIKYANGGTNLYSQWAAPSGPEYTAFQNTVTGGMSALQSAYPGDTVEIAGMIWMQGENDTTSDAYANAYETNLGAFITDVRSRYGADLPFVIGQLSANQTSLNATRLQTVMDAQAAVADANSRTGLVDTNSFALKTDHLHFSAAGEQSLGSAFASVMQTTMNNDPDPPDPVDPPTVTGAVAHYSFDSDYSDSSGNNFHGVAYDGNANGNTAGVSITTTAGESVFGDGAANFTAERDWVQIPERLYYSGNPYSLSFWARDLSDLESGGMVMGISGAGDPTWPASDFFIWTWNPATGDKYLRWRGNGNIPERQADFNMTFDNDWHHYAVVAGDYDEDGSVDDITIYRDGDFVGTDPDNLTGFVIDSIGSGYGNNLDFDWEGQLDEVWIFDRELTADEVTSLYTTNGQGLERYPGDANDDGSVDVTDLGILATNYGTIGGAEWAQADFTGDGNVDVSDLGILATNYGTTKPNAQSVPEPNVLILLVVGLASLFLIRRK